MSKKISLNEYLGLYGLSSPISDYWIDKMIFPHGLTSRQKKKLDKEGEKVAKKYSEKRQACIKEYYQKVATGEIIEPTEIDKLIKIASGHRDNVSVQAAKRVLIKRGYWIDTKGEWQKLKVKGDLNMNKDLIKQKLSLEVKQSLEFFIETDLKIYGEVTSDTLNAISKQGYTYENKELKREVDTSTNDLTVSKQEISQKYVNEIKKCYNNGNLEKAYECWCKLYDLYEPINEMTTEEKMEQFKQLTSYTNQIEDKIVFDVTDYGKEKHYREQGFYDDIVEEQEEEDLDITDDM